MATTVARLEAVLSANTRDFDRDIDRSERVASRAGRSIAKGIGLASAAIGVGLVAAAKLGWDEFAQGQRVAAQTNAVLKSTGAVANVTAKQVDRLATSLMNKSGVDDEVIKSGENMLLTFTNIRNEAGRGNDIFNQSTKILLDMSTALGTDVNKSAIQLGKALNDPIKGITALRRVGVAFTEGQTETIKKLVETGHTMDAQKLILRELNKEFGGSAEAVGKTLPGQLDILRERFMNFLGTIVENVVPVLLQFANFVVPKIVTAFEHVRNWIQRVIDITPQIIAAFRGQAGSMDGARAAARNLGQRLGELVQTNFAAIRTSAPALTQTINNIRESLSNLGTVAKLVLLPILGGMAIFFKFTLPVAIRATAAVLEVLSGWLVTITKGIRWLSEQGGKAVVAFKDASLNALNKVADAAGKFAAALGKVKDALNWIVSNAKKISGVFSGIGGAISGAAGKISPFGDAFDPKFIPRGSRDLHGALPIMQPFANLGAGYGLHITAGRTDHAKFTRSGRISDHWYGKALDLADGPQQMAGFFRALIGNPRVKQAFYDPLGSIFAGHLSSYREGGHSDHVHVATYDKGGFLRPGWNLAYNGLGRPEPVGAGTVNFYLPNYVGSKSELMSLLENAVREFRRRNGRTPF